MQAQPDRVRRHTARAVLHRIDDATVTHLSHCTSAGPVAVQARMEQLDREWDTDRVIETEAATIGLLGIALGSFVNARLLLLPAIVASGVLLYATSGRYPLLPLLRRLGFRSSREIERERYALKALRGDFAGIAEHQPAAPAHRVGAPHSATPLH